VSDEPPRAGVLDWIERAGNALPDPATLFAIGAALVLVASELAVRLDWSVEKTVSRVVTESVLDGAGRPIEDPTTGAPIRRAVRDTNGQTVHELVHVPVRATGLLSSEGLYWILRTTVKNFVDFPPLGVVLVGMLGIGLAERTGFIGALLKALLLAVPPLLLTPTVFFVGVMSSMGLDAGYVVLPPVAAALYRAVGRSPLVGLAAVFAGVSAGFSANLFITSLDPLLAEFSTASARLLDPDYAVAATANWWFMIASTLLLTGVGWAVTEWWVEPRFDRGDAVAPTEDDTLSSQRLTTAEKRGLVLAALAALLVLAVFVAATWVPGAPLHGLDGKFPRWVRVIVPLLFLGFFVPGAAYGVVTGTLRSDKDVARMLSETMAAMGPYIVLAFFAAQFIAWFAHSGLGEMLAISGGRVLARADLWTPLLILGFVGVVGVGNLFIGSFIGSMSAKYAFFAPVFVPMFMQVGISPELTQVAYRVGDSVSNVITPLNPYVVILLVFMRQHAPRAGIGTLVAMMLPYSAAFAIAWSALLVAWMLAGFELGPAGPLSY
jgi:aminobenzoyl-glutamate transport protein